MQGTHTMADTPETLTRKLRELAASLLKKSDFNDFAQIAKKKRQENMDAGVDINGDAFTPLAPSTIRRKRKAGDKHPSKPLISTGVLRNPKIETTKDSAIISVPASREDISEYHQNGDGVPERQHWGITNEAEKEIRELFQEKVNEVIRKIMKGR